MRSHKFSLSRAYFVRCLAILLVFGIALALDFRSSESAATDAPGKIAFSAIRSGYGSEIYVVHADGSNLQDVSNNVANDSSPRWSPDGRTIIFLSDRDGNPGIYAMNADGSNVRCLNQSNTADDSEPSWSPDGKYIAFIQASSSYSAIYLMNADGTNPHRLTHVDAGYRFLNWSGDGISIAYQANYNVCLMKITGLDQQCLSNANGLNSQPVWSPDSKHIAFVSIRNDERQVYVMDANGSNVTRLTNNDAENLDPAWSPDSKYLAYATILADKTQRVSVSNLTGSDAHYLSHPYAAVSEPKWSPDGKQIVFVATQDQSTQIYVVDVDGNNELRVGPTQSQSEAPVWAPQ
jgi:Tol biopolymer transport system component